MFSVVRRLAPVAFLATGACFATQNDIRVLQNDLQVLQAEQTAARAAADSTRADQSRREAALRAQLDQVIAILGSLRDSLHAANGRLSRFQGQVRGDLNNLGQQILAVQALTGQSSEQLRSFRAQLERANQGAAAEPPGSGTTPPPVGGSAPPGAPGPEQLLEIGMQQMRNGSFSTARSAFQDLIRQHPTSLNAPEAQWQIGLAYEAEQNQTAADSVFALVVERYPRAMTVAPTALYKRALSLRAQGKTAEARTLITRLRRDYPTSDAAALSRETFPPPAS
jgi:TolA-binding protein